MGCEADQSPPSSVKIKKEWIYTFTPLYAFLISQGQLIYLGMWAVKMRSGWM